MNSENLYSVGTLVGTLTMELIQAWIFLKMLKSINYL
jgi:hypothetical protein